jgi:hypothetical protein
MVKRFRGHNVTRYLFGSILLSFALLTLAHAQSSDASTPDLNAPLSSQEQGFASRAQYTDFGRCGLVYTYYVALTDVGLTNANSAAPYRALINQTMHIYNIGAKRVGETDQQIVQRYWVWDQEVAALSSGDLEKAVSQCDAWSR